MRFHTVLTCIAALLSLHVAAAKRLPVEAFASLPDVERVKLSPDGSKLASTIKVDLPNIQGTALSITDLVSGETTYPLMAKNEVYTIIWTAWANDHTVLVGTMLPIVRARTQYTGRMKTRETRMMIVNVETGEVKNAIPPNYLRDLDIKPFQQDNVIDMLPDDPDHIYIAITGQVNGVMGMPMSIDPNVYRLNLKNQRMRRIQKPLDNVRHWGTDRQNRVRIAHAYDRTEMRYSIIVRNLDSGDWETLWEFDTFSEDAHWPLGFDTNPNILYYRAYKDGRLAIYRTNLAERPLVPELLYADDKYDVGGSLVYSHQKNAVVGLSTDVGGYIFWDSEFENLKAGIDKALPDADNHIVSFSRDESRYVVLSSSDRDSGTYYLGDRTKGTLDKAAYRYKNLPPKLLSETNEITYKARDGQEIEAYLTLPPGLESAKDLPALMLPHGGPIARNHDGFDYWAQFFANRGYAVLRMNFRGSAGYGHQFRAAGFANWGKEMQDDVQDGALHLIEQGIADPDRICIGGASYGGYAALMGAVKTPDFYQCAMSFAGVSNVEKLAERYRGRYDTAAGVQLGKNDRELREVSPVNLAQNIEVPVLLIHGSEDRQVRPFHSEDMHKALIAEGKDVEYIVLEGGNHYLTNNAHRVMTFKAFDAFLAKHLPAMDETLAAEE